MRRALLALGVCAALHIATVAPASAVGSWWVPDGVAAAQEDEGFDWRSWLQHLFAGPNAEPTG